VPSQAIAAVPRPKYHRLERGRLMNLTERYEDVLQIVKSESRLGRMLREEQALDDATSGGIPFDFRYNAVNWAFDCLTLAKEIVYSYCWMVAHSASDAVVKNANLFFIFATMLTTASRESILSKTRPLCSLGRTIAPSTQKAKRKYFGSKTSYCDLEPIPEPNSGVGGGRPQAAPRRDILGARCARPQPPDPVSEVLG
jgi:hypothetical protein